MLSTRLPWLVVIVLVVIVGGACQSNDGGQGEGAAPSPSDSATPPSTELDAGGISPPVSAPSSPDDPHSPSADISPVDEGERIAGVCVDALDAIKAMDIDRLASLTLSRHREEMDALRPGGERHDRFVQSWRVEAARAWDGKLRGLKVTEQPTYMTTPTREAYCWFWFNDERYAVVSVRPEDDTWRVNQIVRLGVDEWQEAGAELSVPEALQTSVLAPPVARDEDVVVACAGALDAMRENDMKRLAELSTTHNRRIISELTPESGRWKSIQGIRSLVAELWVGTFHGARVDRERGEAKCWFADKDDRHAVLTLKDDEGRWGFEDVHRMSDDRWRAWGSPLDIPTELRAGSSEGDAAPLTPQEEAIAAKLVAFVSEVVAVGEAHRGDCAAMGESLSVLSAGDESSHLALSRAAFQALPLARRKLIQAKISAGIEPLKPGLANVFKCAQDARVEQALKALVQ